jgi:HAE1 family hydrophobic/amphiphilic exporter-1
MHSFWLFFLKKRAFTYMVMVTLLSLGTYCLVTIPKESSPEVIVPIGIVSTVLRGGSGEDVEKLVTNKLEQEIANVQNIDKVTSSSKEGLSVITAQFNASADIDKSLQDLKDAVDQAKPGLPDDASDPVVMKVNFSDQPILILSISQDLSPAGLTLLGDNLEKELKKIKGVSKVIITGTRKKEVEVIIRKDKLERYGLSLNQVVGAIGGANASLPIGNITVSNIDYPLKFAGSIEQPSEVQNITLTTPSGTVVYLRDIAFVADGLQSPKTFSRISQGGGLSENALTLNIYKKSGGDVTVIGDAVKNKIEQLKPTMLLGANVVVSFDGGKQVRKDLKELTRVGFETVILVMLVLFLTIGWRESLVAGLSIPLSFVIAFIGLYASGNTINFLSLFSLILAIGILVDSGIVVAEGIHTRMKKLGSVHDATVATLKEYAWPLIAGTMTTVAVFAPLFFLSGVVGQFIASIPFTIIFVLIASIFVALGLVPLIATVLTKEVVERNRFTEIQEAWFEKIQLMYKTFLGSILSSRKLQNKFFTALGILFVVALLLPITGLLKVQFFPQDDQSFVYVTIEKPQGTPLAQTDLAVRKVEEILYDQKYIESFVTTIGASSAFSSSGGGSNTKLANITVLLTDDRGMTSTEVMEVLRKELSPLSDAIIKVDQGNNGPPSGAPVSITFKGDDLEELSLLTDSAERILKTIPGTRDVETSLRDNGTQFDLVIDRAKASQYGLTSLQVAQALRTAVSGVTASTIKRQGNDIDILVKLDLNADFVNPEDTAVTTIDTIKQLTLTTPSGTVLLGSLITAKISENRAVISHEGQKRIASVSSQLEGKATALEIVSAFKKQEASLVITKGSEIDYGGENEDVEKTFGEMVLALVAGMVGMLAILVLEFNSLRYAFYLLFTIPLSLIGVLGGLAITGQSLSFSSMLGLIALAGVIINHAIILLDSILHRLEYAQEHKDSENNITLHAVIVESAGVRLRPIVLTTVTTVVGMIPLAGVSALWGPLAFAIMFGLTFAMVLTLVLIPVFFYRYPGKAYEDMKKD